MNGCPFGRRFWTLCTQSPPNLRNLLHGNTHVRYYRTSRITWRHCDRQLDPRTFHWSFPSHQNPELAFYAAQFSLTRARVIFVLFSVGKIHLEILCPVRYSSHRLRSTQKHQMWKVQYRSSELYTTRTITVWSIFSYHSFWIIWIKLKYIFY